MVGADVKLQLSSQKSLCKCDHRVVIDYFVCIVSMAHTCVCVCVGGGGVLLLFAYFKPYFYPVSREQMKNKMKISCLLGPENHVRS
jgi:hypothetical protein